MLTGLIAFIAIYAFLYALLEIEIEGAHGWAKNLPTVKVMGKFTMYHVLMNLTVLLTIVAVVGQKYPPSYIVFFTVAWLLLEDIFWFILNPYYTVALYSKQHIPWHANQPWLLGSPLHNYLGAAIMLALIAFTGNKELALSMLAFAAIVLIVTLVAPLYHRKYKDLRKQHDIT